MNETPSAPLDLSLFDTGEASPAPVVQAAAAAVAPAQPVAVPAELAPQPRPARLVETDKLPPDELAQAQAQALKIDFSSSVSLMSHGEGVMNGIAQASRQLLSGVRLGEAGEAGEIAASVLDGIKILRISDLKAEAEAKPQSVMGRLFGAFAQAHGAFQGFAENRKQFLSLMDQQQAKARKTKADLAVSIQLLDQQVVAIRSALHELKIAIAAGQIALDRAEDELEQKRLHAVSTGDAADAAEVQAMRAGISNFRGKLGDMREALVGSAMLIPIIAQNRAAAETRMLKVSNGLLVVIPRLMAVASQAVVQVEIRKAAESAARLEEANRQITLLAAQGAHEAAISAARANAGDTRNLDALAQAADETISTMNEVINIEREMAAQDAERERKLAEIRNKLVVGMQGANANALQK